MVILDLLLPKLLAEGHKVLLFSQMTRMLDIIQDYLHFKGYSYERLDGSCRSEERYLAIKNFNQKNETFLFLLSTRAGGVGLNLVSADYVIFFDSDWNPQVDKQAESRAHRIGQKREVTVIKFVTKSSVEDVILQRSKRKLQLTQTVIEEGGFGNNQKGINNNNINNNNNNINNNNNGDASAKELYSAIKFGINNIFSSSYNNDMPITEEDLFRIIHPAVNSSLDPEPTVDFYFNLLFIYLLFNNY